MKKLISEIIIFSLIFLISSLVTCTQDFTLEETLDGPEGKMLAILPGTAQLGVNETVSFSAEGGVPGYTYSIVSGGGTIDSITGLYTAPGTTGNAVISVKDSYGSIITASVEIIIGGGTPVLVISPTSISVYKGSTANFTATGGTPPYTFSLTAGIGGITAGGLYTAPNTTGGATVRVTDSAVPTPATDNATVTVTDIVTNVDYEVTSVTNTGGTTGGGALSADFVITNTGSSDGSENISWTAYISSDASAGAGDEIASTGTIGPIASLADSGNVTATGTWPDEGDDYFIVIVISASDDLNQLNNSGSSAVITVSDPPVASIDYIVNSVSEVNTPAATGTAINESFTYRNSGTDPGSSNVSWTAYRSANETIDGSDTVIDSGTAPALGAETTSGGITISGTWPPTSGTYYILVRVSAPDDINPVNNTGTSSQFIITSAGDIDYVVDNITSTYPVVTANGPVTEYFDISNIGGAPGSDPVDWIAYASTDTAIGGDHTIASGTVAPSGLPSGGEVNNILINGLWPSTPGSYYIIISLTVSNETITGNNITYVGTFTVNEPPDYTVQSSLIPSSGTPGALLSAGGEYSFVINNSVSAGDGSQSILWNVYRSFDTIYDGSDINIKTGSAGALAANTNSLSQHFSDVSWPAFGANYFFIVTLSAPDEIDITNNTYVTPASVEVAETYTEVEPNNDSGPVAAIVNDLDTVLVGGNLDANQIIKVTGTTDATGVYDTYKFTFAPGIKKIDIYAEWSPGADILDFTLWSNSSTVASSTDTDTASEPASPPFQRSNLTAGGVYKIGVQSKVAGSVYTLYISARP